MRPSKSFSWPTRNFLAFGLDVSGRSSWAWRHASPHTHDGRHNAARRHASASQNRHTKHRRIRSILPNDERRESSSIESCRVCPQQYALYLFSSNWKN